MRTKNLAKRENLILCVMLLAVTAICVFLWYLGTMHFNDRVDNVRFTTGDGTYDLTDIDFADTIVSISGEAEYIPGALLTPEEFEARADEIHVGKVDGYGSVSTTRVKLIFPNDDTRMLAWSSSDYAEKLYINGELRGQEGQPGLGRAAEQPGNTLWYFSVKPEAGNVEIVRQISNFTHRNGGGHAGIYIGSEENIRLRLTLITDFDGVAIGLFLALFLVHLTLYIMLRSYRGNLYFALLCLTWALRAGVINSEIFIDIIPPLAWEAAFRTEYLTVPVGIVLVTMIIMEVFPAVLQKWPVRVIVGVCTVFAVMFLLADTLFMSYAIVWCNVAYIAAILWIAVRFVMKLPGMYRHSELMPEHFALLYGLIVFFYAAIHDALYFNDINLFGIKNTLTDVSLLIFTFSQMIAMSRATMREFVAAREAEQRLEQENAELEINLREAVKGAPRTITHGQLKLDTVAQKAFLGERDMRLSPKEYSILRFLLMNEGKELDAEAIYGEVWKQPMLGDNRALQARVSALRKKLEGSEFEIVSVYGKGYCLESRGAPEGLHKS